MATRGRLSHRHAYTNIYVCMSNLHMKTCLMLTYMSINVQICIYIYECVNNGYMYNSMGMNVYINILCICKVIGYKHLLNGLFTVNFSIHYFI